MAAKLGSRRRRAEMSLGGMGFDLAASVGVAVLLGWWIDKRYDTAPWGILICAMVGIIGGLLNFVRAGQAAARRASAEAESRAETESRESNPDE